MLLVAIIDTGVDFFDEEVKRMKDQNCNIREYRIFSVNLPSMVILSI